MASPSPLAGCHRIVVLGSGGAGKSSLARQLGGILELPVIHLDRLFWHAGWVPTPREEWIRVQRELVAGERWILDGNYGGTLPERLAAADAVLFLDLPRWTCLARTIGRTLRAGGLPRPDMAEGCPERMGLPYLRFLWWIWKYPSRSRPRLLARLSDLPEGARVLRLRSAREVEVLVRLSRAARGMP